MSQRSKSYQKSRLNNGQNLVDSLAENLADSLADGLADGLAESLADGLADGLVDGLAESLADGLAEALGSDYMLDSRRDLFFTRHRETTVKKYKFINIFLYV